MRKRRMPASDPKKNDFFILNLFKMKIPLLILFVTTINIAQGQIGGKKSKDAYMLFDSIRINPGDTLHLGSGTDRRGDFVSIYQPPNVLIGIAETSLPRNFSGKFLVIKHFKVQKDKRTGEKTIAVVSPGGLNYVVDIEQAVKLQEITSINRRSFINKPEPAQVIINNKPSVADELAKLKKLYQDSVLTKEEYEAQKKKLLEQ